MTELIDKLKPYLRQIERAADLETAQREATLALRLIEKKEPKK